MTTNQESEMKTKQGLSARERELLSRAMRQMRNHFKGSLTLSPNQINEGVNSVFALEAKLEKILEA